MGRKYELSYYEQYAAFINRLYPFPFPDYVFELKEEVDGTILQKAVEKAILVHPAFKLTLRDTSQGFRLEEIDAVPVVREAAWKESFTFGEDGLMWVLSYTGRKIVFTAFHLLCDGMGAMSFLGDVLRFYFAQMGKYQGELPDIHAAANAESCANGYISAVGTTDQRWQDIDYDELSCLKETQFRPMDADQSVIYRFDFKADEIHAQAQVSGTSTSAVISYYLAKAMVDTLGQAEGKISVAVVADLRTRFATKSDRNFTAESNLIYDIAKEKDWTPEAVQQDLRRQLLDFLALERQQARIARENELQQEILNMSEDDQNMQQNFLFQTFCTLRANICYSHLTRLGIPEEIEGQLEDFHVAGAKGFSPRICVFGSNLKDKVSITISEDLQDNAFVKAFAKVLAGEQIGFQQSVLDLHGNMNYDLQKSIHAEL